MKDMKPPSGDSETNILPTNGPVRGATGHMLSASTFKRRLAPGETDKLSKQQVADYCKLFESELKQLYVAVTRPRVRLWIFDQGDASSWDRTRTPVYEFLQRTLLCETVMDAEGFARSSTAEDHIVAAQELYKQALEETSADLFKTAALRFADGGRPAEKNLCMGNVYNLEALHEDTLAKASMTAGETGETTTKVTVLRRKAVVALLQAAVGVRSDHHRKQAISNAIVVLRDLGDSARADQVEKASKQGTC